MPKLKIKCLSALFFLTFLLSSFSAVPAYAGVSDWQKGFHLRLNNQEKPEIDIALIEIKSTGADYVTFSPGWLTSNETSSDVYRKAGTTNDELLTYTINKAHEIGLKVMLKPHLDIANGTWRANLNPINKEQFFQNYSTMMINYADIANRTNVEQFSVGAELVKISTNQSNQAYWNNLIDHIRNIYKGELTYSANADKFASLDEVNNLIFWDKLDYIGISFYRPLSVTYSPTLESLEEEWKKWEQNYISQIEDKYNKPLLFTEIGYRSINGASIRPWDFSFSNSTDQQEQADLYKAFFEQWENKSYIKGVHFWEWEIGENIESAKNYTPESKLAEKIITEYFSPVYPLDTKPISYPLVTDLNRYSIQEIEVGSEVYTDRNYKFEFVPQKLANQYFVKPANNEKTSSVKELIEFKVNEDAFVYIAYDERAIKLPSWLIDYKSGNEKIKTNDAIFKIYQRQVVAQTNVTTGGNLFSPAEGAESNYFIIVSKNKLYEEDSEAEPITVEEPENPPIENQGEYNLIIHEPENNEIMSGEKKLKAYFNNLNLDQYTASYKVDNKDEENMPNDATDTYKQAKIDFDKWTWNNEGPYKLTIVAKDLSGVTIDSETLSIFIDH